MANDLECLGRPVGRVDAPLRTLRLSRGSQQKKCNTCKFERCEFIEVATWMDKFFKGMQSPHGQPVSTISSGRLAHEVACCSMVAAKGFHWRCEKFQIQCQANHRVCLLALRPLQSEAWMKEFLTKRVMPQ